METEKAIVNKVASSGLVTFDLETYYTPGERAIVDVGPQLYEGLILREKDFREYIRTTDWSAFQDKFVAVYCSADAIVPTWAFMLVAIALEPFARKIVYGSAEALESVLFHEALSTVDWSVFEQAKVVIKGCSQIPVPVSAYVEATSMLRSRAASLMFGEPCSTVPLYKKPKAV